MSLFSTIAHGGANPARGLSPKAIGMAAAGLAVGVAIGFVIINSRTVTEPSSRATSAAVIGSQSVVDSNIPWWNTEAFKNLVPATSAAVIGSQSVVDSNIPWWNTESFKNLVAR